MRTWMGLAGLTGLTGAAVASRLVGGRRRLLHPGGRSYAGELRVWGLSGGRAGADLLDRPASYPATVRVSKGTPTPSGWPDVLGLACRIHPPAGGRVDLLLSTTGTGPVLRRVPVPRRCFASAYGSILAFRLAGSPDRVHLAALPDPRSAPLGDTLDSVTAAASQGRAHFLLAVSGPGGDWRPFGRLSLGTPLPPETDAQLAFDPVRHQAPGLRATGPVQALRLVTYRMSRRWRGVHPDPADQPVPAPLPD